MLSFLFSVSPFSDNHIHSNFQTSRPLCKLLASLLPFPFLSESPFPCATFTLLSFLVFFSYSLFSFPFLTLFIVFHSDSSSSLLPHHFSPFPFLPLSPHLFHMFSSLSSSLMPIFFSSISYSFLSFTFLPFRRTLPYLTSRTCIPHPFPSFPPTHATPSSPSSLPPPFPLPPSPPLPVAARRDGKLLSIKE